MRGRHSADSSAGFYKELGVMILGILLVGAAVFLVLYFTLGDGDVVSPSSSSPPATTLVEVTTTTATTTTIAAPTTSMPSTTSTTTSTTVPVRAPSEVRVLVLNSIRVAGAAGRLTSILSDEGYKTLQAADYQSEQDPSRIWYQEGFSVEANALLEYLPGALVEEIPETDLGSGADVVLVLGVGHDG